MGKQVGTPRFYVDMPSFLHATGQLGWDAGGAGAELLYMNCANPYIVTVDNPILLTPFAIGANSTNPPKTSFPVNFCALLNHNLGSNSNEFKVVGKEGIQEQNTAIDLIPNQEVLNSNHTGAFIDPQYNGTTIFTFSDADGADKYWRSFSIYYDGDNNIDAGTHQLGSFVVGKYWDAPNAPDLKLTMSRRFDGIKQQKTIGGKTLSNIYYDGATEWTMNHPNNGTYKYPPFELDTTANVDTAGFRFDYRAKSGLGRKGLRSWNLTFSYIDDSDMWMDNEISSKLINDSINDDIAGGNPTGGSDANPMLSDDSFNFVWNCTLGGTLPFIFQPDKTNNNADQFAICTFKNKSLNVRQVASNVYSLSITIDEVA
tara:strand:- start:101 stop:1213 length:1113 start_codon:yes stop_codon:yes gene_type:complete